MEVEVTPRQAWIFAARPKTLTVAFIAVLVGSALAWSTDVTFNWFIAVLALICALLIQIGANLINDAADFKSGADTEERMGFPRATQMGWLTHDQVYKGGLLAFGFAFILGIPLIMKGGIIILILLILSIISAYAYTAGPFPLAYNGLGEVFVMIFFGYICTSVPYYLQTGNFDSMSFLAGTQIGLLSTVLIAINNTRDIVGDRKVGKRTLAAQFGLLFGKLEITFCVMVPLLICLLWGYYDRIIAAFLPLCLFPLATIIVNGIMHNPPGKIYNNYFVLATLYHLVFGLLLTLGLLL
ncbi:MAG: 1,4-dihydroxy-2-naphthoate octaprenyltransferase [Chlamydiae bacterium]|nr:1,4-dihydroxy-2-naphthoate octaprenyltransferase [Chlamydiota bacterium]